jgi:long-chain acyl-CoA synthetase
MSPDLIDTMLGNIQHDKNMNANDQKLHRVKNIILFEEVKDPALLEKANGLGINILTYDQILKAGQECAAKTEFYVPKTEDVFMFSYTSGTTGDPKGVKLTHKMCINCSSAMNYRLKPQ